MTTTTANAAAPQTEPDWGAIRREFPTLENFVYLDISKKAILPQAGRGIHQRMGA